MGGCPNGPLQSGPPAPTNIVVTGTAASGSIEVTWTPTVNVAGVPPCTGYMLQVINNGGGAVDQVSTASCSSQLLQGCCLLTFSFRMTSSGFQCLDQPVLVGVVASHHHMLLLGGVAKGRGAQCCSIHSGLCAAASE
jgi:hypothetical protein